MSDGEFNPQAGSELPCGGSDVIQAQSRWIGAMSASMDALENPPISVDGAPVLTTMQEDPDF
jgi:hypothetical protein